MTRINSSSTNALQYLLRSERTQSKEPTEKTQQLPPPPQFEDEGEFDAGKTRPRPPFIDDVANALGLSADQVDSALRSGTSISQLAEQQGVSLDTVTGAVAKGLQSKLGDVSDEQAQQIAQQLVEMEPPAQAQTQQTEKHRHKPPFLDAAAQALGLDSDTLAQRLQSGESLQSIAQSQGVDSSQLQSALAADFQSKHQEVTDEQAQQVAQQLLEGRRPMRGFRSSELQWNSENASRK